MQWDRVLKSSTPQGPTGDEQRASLTPCPLTALPGPAFTISLLADEFSSSAPRTELISPENYNNEITVCLLDAENLWLDSK